MSQKLTAVITKDGKWYVARCLELPVTTQGETIDKARANLKEAVELYIESFEPEDIPQSTGEVMLYPIEIAVSA